MSEDEIDDLAYGIVEDYLEDGPEHIAIVEATHDNYEDASDEDIDAVAAKVREYLNQIHRKF